MVFLSESFKCLLFQNALKFDDKNLDTLLALGISCTNILDEIKAMNFLKMWILNNKAYEGLQVDVDFFSFLIQKAYDHTF